MMSERPTAVITGTNKLANTAPSAIYNAMIAPLVRFAIRGVLAGRPRGPDQLRRRARGQHGVRRVPQRGALLGDGESHRARSLLYARGRPSSRSATILRWISLVPA